MTNHFLQRALNWAEQFEQVVYLNPNDIDYPHQPFLHVLAVGSKRCVKIKLQSQNSFESLYQFWKERPSWLFGYFSYDLKNELENLSSQNTDYLHFPDFYFFEPEHLLLFDSQGQIINPIPLQVLEEIKNTDLPSPFQKERKAIQQRMSKNAYLEKVKSIKNDIKHGDIYELNLCMEFFVEGVSLEPIQTYLHLNQLSPMPFSAFLKVSNHYAFCASPERFIKKQGDKLISQPIKGTIRRGNSKEEDEELKKALRSSEKEQAENMMIVDLVRNDFAKSAVVGTTHASEIFGVYSFTQVHQLISTVEAKLSPQNSWVKAIANAFPMGSMTGAPKFRAMQLIEKYEQSKRGLYSGTIGYVTPEGDLDFNVVIRTLLYNKNKQYASFQVGGAITYDSDPESEWQECLLKAKAIRSLFE